MDKMDGRDRIGGIARVLNDVYPIQRRGAALRDAITEELVEGISDGNEDREEVFDDLEDTFAVKNLRHDLGGDLPVVEEEEEPSFSSNPDASFLPHIIDVAEQARVPLVFVRVKRRPDASGVTEESPQLRQYIRELRAYFEERGVPFYDETPDKRIPESWYADGDHIAPEYKAEYTEHFYRALDPLFE
jgi:hypothetical protein